MTTGELIVGVLCPMLAGVMLYFLTRAVNHADKRAADRDRERARDAWNTHVVLRELVRATRELGAHMTLPPGW